MLQKSGHGSYVETSEGEVYLLPEIPREFTGTFVGLTCADHMYHRKCADFDYFEYLADEEAPVE